MSNDRPPELTPDQRRRAHAILEHLVEEHDPATPIVEAIHEACPDDEAIREEVLQLWHHAKSTISHNAGLATLPASEVPTTIGPYSILQEIGEGGFGVVYLAEQTAPVRRRVALKIIKLGMDSKQVVARFEAERQALAMMDHPHVARVYDAGTTDTGRPYFVMELVRGLPITEHCERHRLDIDDRLELFASVCDAVQHAHTKAVVHRDLKPSNVLVEYIDGKATPKVIDFGVAKALFQPLTNRTIFTEHGQLIGTPEYMSPEQAEMSGQDVDTQSDVYSLGVLLYELLTGTLPFESARLREAGLAGIQEIIRTADPPTPSARLSGLGAGVAEIAARRRCEPGALVARLRRELEWIPLKAMRKERTERYRSAAELGDDVRRYVAGDALLAGPETAIYRARKLIRRHRRSVTTAAIVFTVLVLGVVASLMFAIGEKHAREQLEREQELTAAELQRTTQLLSLTQALLRWSGSPVDEVTQRALVERVVRWLESSKAPPRTRALQCLVAAESLYYGDDVREDTLAILTMAEDALAGVKGPSHHLRGRMHTARAWLAFRRYKLSDAATEADKAIALLSRDDVPLHKCLADAQRLRSVVHWWRDEKDQSADRMKDAFVTIWRLMGQTATRESVDAEIRALATDLAYHWAEGRPGAAFVMAREFIEPIIDTIGADPMVPEGAAAIAMYLDEVEENKDAAAPFYRLAVMLSRDLLGDVHPTTEMLSELALESLDAPEPTDLAHNAEILTGVSEVFGEQQILWQRIVAFDAAVATGDHDMALQQVDALITLYDDDSCNACTARLLGWRVWLLQNLGRFDELDDTMRQVRSWLADAEPPNDASTASMLVTMNRTEASIMGGDRAIARMREAVQQATKLPLEHRSEVLGLLLDGLADLDHQAAAESLEVALDRFDFDSIPPTPRCARVLLDVARQLASAGTTDVTLLLSRPDAWWGEFPRRRSQIDALVKLRRHGLWRVDDAAIRAQHAVWTEQISVLEARAVDDDEIRTWPFHNTPAPTTRPG